MAIKEGEWSTIQHAYNYCDKGKGVSAVSDETVLKKFGGTAIYVTQSGKFGARIKGKAVEKRTLREIEKAITHSLHAVTVMTLDDYSGQRGCPSLVKIAMYDDKKNVYLTDTGETISLYRSLYHFDEEAIAAFRALEERRQSLEREWESLRDNLTRFKPTDLPAMQAYDALAGDEQGE